MIGKEEFIKIVNELYDQNKRVDTLTKVFSESFSDPIIDYGFKLFDQFIEVCFTKDGCDWVNYYLYENPEGCYYEDGKKIPLKSLDNLWNLIKDYRK